MRKKVFYSGILLILLLSLNSLAQSQRPNIILILADDMGYSDIGCFGSEIKTPNIDKLASNGIKLSQFYNSARCCPTRASLLTGLYPHMAGIGWMTIDRGQPGYRGDLNDQCVTIAEVLKNGGYSTYGVGKWHVTSQNKYNQDKKNWPLQRGFDKYFGIIGGVANYFAPKGLTNGNREVKPGKDFYFTDAIADSAAHYIRLHKIERPQSSFFMYVAFNAPHWPLQAKPEDIKKYENYYLKGWDEIRGKRYAKQLALGIFDKSVKLNPRDARIPAWESLPMAEKKLWAKRMAIYAAQIDCMDQGIGRILEQLKKDNLTDNTFIVFMSDNGGCAEKVLRQDTSYTALGTEKSFQSYRLNWANVSNTPFNLYKHYVHEGGISTPFIASWPNGIQPTRKVVSVPANIIDIMPTFASISGSVYPEEFKGKKIPPMAGTSLMPLFRGKNLPERPLFWEHEANRAIRYKNWKLVSRAEPNPPYTGPWELYDMTKDRAETENLVKKYPKIVSELESMWNAWAKENKVYPLRATFGKMKEQ